LAKEDELLRVQIELTIVQDKLDSLNRVRPALSALLAEALGHAAGDDLLPWPMQASFPPSPPSTELVLAAIREANPDLSALDSLIESDAKQVELARKKGYPDFTVGIDYTSISTPRQIRPDRPFPASLHAGRRLLTGTSAGPAGTLIDLYSLRNSDEPISYRSGGRDNVMISLRINVPIWRKRVKAEIKEAQLMERATEHAKHRKELSLGSAAQMALFGMDDARRRFNLYEESLLPKAQQTYESLQSAYGTGDTSADFLDLLDSVRQLLDFELEQIRAARDLQIAAADLELLLGRPWKEGVE
jgi:outer membrane protein TolC